MKTILRRLQKLIPLSWQGFFLALLITYFIIYPIQSLNDVILTVVALCLAPLLGLGLIATALLRRKLQRKLSLQFSLQSSTENREPFVAGTPLTLYTQAQMDPLYPFFSLELRLHWNHHHGNRDQLSFTMLSASSFWKTTNLSASQVIKFPHRGIWSIKSISATLRGPLWLTIARWNLPLPPDSSWEIGVTLPETLRLPIVTSATQPGDSIIDYNNRLGDYYDLKPYDRTDGMGRIVWKIYARSGQLISRKPEAAATPEGRMLLLLWADHSEDDLAALTLRYLIAVSEAEISYTFGCSGMGNSSPTSNYTDSRKLIIAAVSNSNADPLVALEALFTSLPDAHLYQGINIFCGEKHFSTEAGLTRVTALGEAAATRNLEPIFIVPNIQTKPSARQARLTQLEQTAIKLKLLRAHASTEHFSPTLLPTFEDLCTRNHWKLIR